MTSTLANAPEVVTPLASILSKIAAVVAQLACITTNLAVISLSDILADPAPVGRDIMTVAPNLARILAKIAAFDARSIVIAAESGLVCEGGLRTGGSGAREHQCRNCGDGLSFHNELPASGLLVLDASLAPLLG